jgi:antitoxin (DNA-binding transcriptional repressor) of toxin-antitoxin stability system
MEATLEYAETHFAQLLRRVVQGEEVVLSEGLKPVARILPVASAPTVARPKVGVVTSGPVRWSEASFAAMNEADLKELGLL